MATKNGHYMRADYEGEICDECGQPMEGHAACHECVAPAETVIHTGGMAFAVCRGCAAWYITECDAIKDARYS